MKDLRFALPKEDSCRLCDDELTLKVLTFINRDDKQWDICASCVKKLAVFIYDHRTEVLSL